MRVILSIILLCLISLAHGQTYYATQNDSLLVGNSATVNNGLILIEQSNLDTMTLSSAYKAVRARMSPKPTRIEDYYYNAFVRAEIRDSVWSRLWMLYIQATSSKANAKLNWIAAARDLTEQGTVTHIPYRGSNGFSSTAYYKTGWTPSLDTSFIGLNKAMFGTYLTNISYSSTNAGIIGCGVTTTSVLRLNSNTTGFQFGVNSALSSKVVAVNTYYVSLQRTSASNMEYYADGVEQSITNRSSVSLIPHEFLIGSINTSGTVIAGNASTHMADWIGLWLTNAQQLKHYNNLNALLKQLGAIQ